MNSTQITLHCMIQKQFISHCDNLIIIITQISFQMSLFYGKKQESNLYPELDQKEQNKNSQPDDIFMKRQQQRQAGPRASVFLPKDPEPEKEPGCFQKCCPCLSLSYYKDYFKVTNTDVKKRILCNLKFWSGGFFTPPQQQYDLYGPFWLYTTMVFVTGAVSNVLIYQNNPNNFQYNFQVIGVAMTIFYLLGLGLSAIIGLIFGCIGLNSKTSQIVCIYGYSMATYIICILLCTINMTLLTWLFLLYAAGTKVGFLLKNIFQLEVPAAKKIMIVAIVIIQAAIQFLVIKFAFIKTQNSSSVSAAFSHMQVENHEFDGFLHLRHYAGL